MVTKEEALAVYNLQHGTEYATVSDLGKAVVKHLLKTAWIEEKKREVYNQAEKETGGMM